jgi:alcohol dehydrogenase
MPATFELAAMLIRPGGHVANIGVHGKPATLDLETLWTRDVTITTGLVDTYSTPTLSRLMATRQLQASGRRSTDDKGSQTARGNHENS